ncbi:hypothetical protein HMPREF1207_02342 [Paenibacillus sp. HGH0039]|nr:hypothetical protein HMPREF1207_02342 [Paenibacillus sp. HGH0039]
MTLDQEQAQPGGAKPSNSLRGVGSLRIAAVRGGLSQDDLNQLDSLADTCLSHDRFTVKLNRNMLKERARTRSTILRHSTALASSVI